MRSWLLTLQVGVWLTCLMALAAVSMNDRLLTVPEVSQRLHKAPATLRWWRHEKRGPKSFKLGRTIVYREADVEAWLDAQYADDPHPARPA